MNRLSGCGVDDLLRNPVADHVAALALDMEFTGSMIGHGGAEVVSQFNGHFSAVRAAPDREEHDRSISPSFLLYLIVRSAGGA